MLFRSLHPKAPGRVSCTFLQAEKHNLPIPKMTSRLDCGYLFQEHVLTVRVIKQTLSDCSCKTMISSSSSGAGRSSAGVPPGCTRIGRACRPSFPEARSRRADGTPERADARRADCGTHRRTFGDFSWCGGRVNEKEYLSSNWLKMWRTDGSRSGLDQPNFNTTYELESFIACQPLGHVRANRNKLPRLL